MPKEDLARYVFSSEPGDGRVRPIHRFGLWVKLHVGFRSFCSPVGHNTKTYSLFLSGPLSVSAQVAQAGQGLALGLYPSPPA